MVTGNYWEKNLETAKGKENGGGTRSRTEVDGFAIRCMATLPFRRIVLTLSVSEIGASNEVRTRDLNLGKVALYQLSYTRTPEAF